MSKMVYLAGPISGLSYEGCTDWRKAAAEALGGHGIVALDPMRGKEYLANRAVIEPSYEALGCQLSTGKGITSRDRWDATRCDVLLVNVLGANTTSIGTIMEIAWADGKRTPIVLAMEPAGNPHDHPMVREAAGFVVSSLDDALAIVAAILGDGQRR